MRAAASDSSPSDESRRLHDTRTRSATWETAAATAKSFIDSNSASTSAVDTTSAKRKPAAPRAPRKRPNRKTRTSEVRRDEIDLLQKESKYLEAKVEFLKHRAGVHDQQSLDKQALDNALFREWLRNQQYVLAGLKSAVATDSSDHIPSPLSTRICLGDNLGDRRAHLLAIKAQKIHDARQFLAKRTQFMDLSKPFSDLSRSQSAVDGTMCTTKLDVVPLYNATSVKQVFDTMLYYVLNIEMSTADVNGDVIVREEDDTGDESVSQNRFLFLKKEFSANVETNNAIFCQYTPRQSGSGSLASEAAAPDAFALPDASDEGLVVVDFVDEDVIYPYRPSERLRDNVTNVFSIKAYPLSTQQQHSPHTRQSPKRAGRHRSHHNGDEDEDEPGRAQEQEHVVVMARWFQAKFHPTTLPIPIDTLVDLRKDMDHVSDAVISLVRARFRSPPTLAFDY